MLEKPLGPSLMRTLLDKASEDVTAQVILEHLSSEQIADVILKSLGEGIFSPTEMNIFLDQLLNTFVPAGTVNSMKSFNAARVSYVLSQIPLTLSVTAPAHTDLWRSCWGVPLATILPRSIMIAREQAASTSSRICVEKIMAFFWPILRIKPRTSCF